MGTSARLHSANRPVVRRLGVLAASVVLLVPGGAALAGRVVAATEVCPPGAVSVATGVCEVTFTNSTTWTIPGGVFSVDVVAVGAGGAGGARTTEYTQPELGGSGGGGGGGQVVQANGKPVMPGETVTVSVGAGGVGNNGEDAYGGGGSSVAASRLDVRASGGGGGRNGEAILKDYWYYTLTAGHGGTSGSGKAGGDNQWNDMGGLFPNYKTVTAGGGGGGASGVGGDGVGYTGGQGGAGVTPSQGLFADQTMAYGGGGGGGTSCDGCYGHGGATAGGGVGGANLRGGQDGADNTGGGGGGDNGKGGSGVVIVRFANPIDLPLVSTGAAASITAGSAAAGGTAGAGPSRAAVTARGVVYSTTTADADPRLGGEGTATVADATSGEGTFSVRLSGLAASTAYSYRAYATNAYGTSYGSVANFTTPAKLAQAITWDTLPPEGAVAGGSGYQPKASVETGLPVSISVDEASSKVCSINAGTVVYLAAGDCVLHANQAGNGDYLAAPQVEQSFAVATASQAITVTAHAPVTAPDGTSFSVTATATSGLDVAISVDGVCSITRGGVGSATVQMTAGTGTCTVRYNQAGNSTGWSAAPEITESVTAGVVSLTATVTIAAKTYDGTTSATVTGCTLSGVVGTDVVTCDATSAVGVFSAPDAGFQSVTATGLKLTGADAARYAFDGTSTGMGTISQRDLRVMGTHTAVAYSDPAPTEFTISYSGFVAGDTAATYVSGAPACATTYAKGDAPGSYQIQCTLGTLRSLNYEFHGVSDALENRTPHKVGTLTVVTKALTATVTIAAKTYDGTTSATVTGCTLSGVVGTDVVTCDATSAVGVFSAPDAGFQSVTATGLKLTGADAARYAFDGTSTGMGKISPATATCTVKPYSVIFDGGAHAASGSCTGVGGTHLPAADLDLAGTIHTDAGTYSADPWTFSDPVGNYADQDGTVADAIGQASSTTIVSCASGPFAYRGSAQTPCTASVIGAGGLSQPVPLAYSANTNAGTATATAAFAGDANHGGSSDSKTFTIQPAPVTMTAGGYRGAYDGFSHAPAACVVRGSYTGALACSDSLASVGPDVGSGVVTPVLVLNGEIATNFAVTSVAGSFDISPKALTAELELTYKAYDGTTAVPLYFCSLSGVVGTDDVTCDTTAATAAYESKDAGMRRATATGLRLTGTAAGRYTFDGTASGTGQIGQLHLHVSASHDPIAYGDPAPTGFDIAYQGFLEGETAETAMSGAPACSTTYAAGMAPRPYDIQCTRGTLSAANYQFVASEPLYASFLVKAGTLLVQRKALTAELELTYKAYDGTTAVPLYFCSLSGVVGTDDVTCDTTAATAAYESKDAGMRRATATGLRLTGTAAGRYTFDGTASGTGQIGQLHLHVSASHDPIAYGDPAPTGFDIAYQGFLEGETAETAMSGAPACSTTYAAGMAPRPYDIQCTRGTLSAANYQFVASEPLYASFLVKAGTLLVQRKALTATVTVASKQYDGTTTATITGCSLSGVVGTDDVTCAWTSAVASFSAADAGSHDVGATSLMLTGTAAGRYTFDGIATGTGEILMGAPACTITPYHVTFDGTMHTATGSCTGVSGEPLAGLVLTGTAHTVAGTYADAWTFADVTGNYAAASGTVTDIVDKAAATVVYSDPAYAVISSGTTVGVTLTASVSPAFCGPASFTVTGSGSADPVAPVSAGRYTLSAGMYAIVASLAEPNCTGQDQAVLAVVSAGDTANGGGSYKAATIQQGSPRVNFGFTVQKTTKAIKGSTNLSVAYKGQLLWMNNGQWRVRASVSTSSITTATGQWVSGDQAPYGVMASCPTQFTSTLPTGSSPKCGSLTGTGTLESWDATANGGLGAWVPSTQYGPPITFTATLYDGGTVKVCSKKSCTTTGNADWFGIQFDPVSGTVIRESAPMPLMVGSLKIN